MKINFYADAVRKLEVELLSKEGEGTRALIAMGIWVENYAKKLCPVRTGRLRASISTNWTDSGISSNGDTLEAPQASMDAPFKVIVGTKVPYSVHVEYGTVRQAAQPYLRPALEALQSKGRGIVPKDQG